MYIFRVPFIDNTKSPSYELITVACICISFVVAHIVPAIDGMFITFSLNIKELFINVQEDLERCTFYDWKSEVRNIVQTHIKLIQVTEKLSKAFNEIVLAQILLTSAQICVIGFQILSGRATILKVLANLMFLFVIMIQLCTYCYGGEQISHESFNMNKAVQLSDWYKLHTFYRKDIGMVMMRSQRPLKVKAYIWETSM